jgi:hypothetical protein
LILITLTRLKNNFQKNKLPESDEKILIIGQDWFELRTSFEVPRSPKGPVPWGHHPYGVMPLL